MQQGQQTQSVRRPTQHGILCRPPSCLQLAQQPHLPKRTPLICCDMRCAVMCCVALCWPQVSDDPEQYTNMLPERRLIQANTSSSFTSAGPARQQQHNRLQAAGTAGLGDLFAGSSGSGAGAR